MINFECEYCGSRYEKFHDEGCPGCGARRMVDKRPWSAGEVVLVAGTGKTSTAFPHFDWVGYSSCVTTETIITSGTTSSLKGVTCLG